VTQQLGPEFRRHFLYVFGSQLIVLVTGIIKALIIPVLLGLSDYGYWQIYIFYTVYIGVFTFGYGDGLYLKYGGYNLCDLPLGRLRMANALYLTMLVFGAFVLVAISWVQVDPNRQFVLLAVAANVAILGVISNISLTLQATNNLKNYAFLNSIDKVFFAFTLPALVSEDFQSFEYLIWADLGAKLVAMLVMLHRFRQLFIGPIARLSDGMWEFNESIGAGIQLLLANLSGMLVLGVGRIIVEYFGVLTDYAYYAFAMALANVVLMSVTALSIVIYPTLRRQPQENYIGYFNTTTRAYNFFLLVMLTGYFPAVVFIKFVAIKYTPVLDFLNLMFVITVLQGKMQLINNTYYKALRLERTMLWANAMSLVIAVVLSVTGFMFTQSILAIAYAALVTMLYRVYSSEIFLRRHMGGVLDRSFFTEILVLCVFLLTTLMFTTSLAAAVWHILVATIAIHKRSEFCAMWYHIRGVVR
jgi:O-antigen/teichoic acid export membrane protein